MVVRRRCVVLRCLWVAKPYVAIYMERCTDRVNVPKPWPNAVKVARDRGIRFSDGRSDGGFARPAITRDAEASPNQVALDLRLRVPENRHFQLFIDTNVLEARTRQRLR